MIPHLYVCAALIRSAGAAWERQLRTGTALARAGAAFQLSLAGVGVARADESPTALARPPSRPPVLRVVARTDPEPPRAASA